MDNMMSSKGFALACFFFLFCCFQLPATACISQTANFDILAIGMDINVDKLIQECLPQNCLKKDGGVVIRSSYDPRVALYVYADYLLWQLPYKKGVFQELVPDGMEPDQFDLRLAAQLDVEHLRRKGYVRTSNEEFVLLLNAIRVPRQKVMFCHGRVLTGSINSTCAGGPNLGLLEADGLSDTQGLRETDGLAVPKGMVSQQRGCGGPGERFILPASDFK